MILHRIVEDGEEVSKVAEEFRVSFRTVQALLRDASTNAIKLSRFCKEIPVGPTSSHCILTFGLVEDCGLPTSSSPPNSRCAFCTCFLMTL